MKRKIVIIRGIVTSGKTTTSHELAKVLPKWIFVDVWKIKEMFEPLGLKDRTPLKSISKKAILMIIREVIRKMGINIIIQESSQSFIKKYLKKDLKKHNYKVYSFFLDLKDEDVAKRDKQREKPTMGLEKEVKTGKWRERRVKPEKEDIVINTSKYSIKKVVNMILKEINEKGEKHPKLHALRKSWQNGKNNY